MKSRTIAALAVAIAVGAFAPRRAAAVDLDGLRAQAQSDAPAARQQLQTLLDSLQNRAQTALDGGRYPTLPDPDVEALRAQWPTLPPALKDGLEEPWGRVLALFDRLNASRRAGILPVAARARWAVADFSSQAAGLTSYSGQRRFFDNAGGSDGAFASPGAGTFRKPLGRASPDGAATPPQTQLPLGFTPQAAPPPTPSPARQTVLVGDSRTGVLYESLPGGLVAARPAAKPWPRTVLRKTASGMAVVRVELGDGLVQKPVAQARGLWLIEQDKKTAAYRLDLKAAAKSESVRAAALFLARQGLWGALSDAQAAYYADAVASFLGDAARRLGKAGAPAQAIFQPSGELALSAGSLNFLCRFEPTLSGWPDGVNPKGVGLSIYAKGPGGKDYTRTVQYLGDWGQERVFTEAHTNTDSFWWWASGPQAVQTNTVVRVKRGPDGEWQATGQTAKLPDTMLHPGVGILGEVGHAVDALGEGAADLVGAGVSLALASSPAYLALVKATGGDVAASEKDLMDRAKADFFGNAASRALGANFGGDDYRAQLEMTDMTKYRGNVGQEMASLGHAKTGAVLQGGQEFANQVPLLLTMGAGSEWLEGLGNAEKLAQYGRTGQVAIKTLIQGNRVVGTVMGSQAVIGLGHSLGDFTGTLLYGDFNSEQGLAALRDFTNNALSAPMTLAVFRPAFEGIGADAKARLKTDAGVYEAPVPDTLAAPVEPGGVVGRIKDPAQWERYSKARRAGEDPDLVVAHLKAQGRGEALAHDDVGHALQEDRPECAFCAVANAGGLTPEQIPLIARAFGDRPPTRSQLRVFSQRMGGENVPLTGLSDSLRTGKPVILSLDIGREAGHAVVVDGVFSHEGRIYNSVVDSNFAHHLFFEHGDLLTMSKGGGIAFPNGIDAAKLANLEPVRPPEAAGDLLLGTPTAEPPTSPRPPPWLDQNLAKLKSFLSPGSKPAATFPIERYFSPEELASAHPAPEQGDIYHDIRHSARVAQMAYDFARGRGLAPADAKFVGEVALLHDFDPARQPGTPARVPDTLAALDEDFAGRKSLTGQPGHSILKERFGWDQDKLTMAKAIIQRTEYPFGGAHQNPYYRTASPLARYEAMLDALPPGDRRFVLREGALLSEYADKTSHYSTEDFAGVHDGIIAGLANEINTKAGKGSMTLKNMVIGSAPFLSAAGDDAGFALDRQLAAKYGVDIQFPGRQEAFSQMPSAYGRRFEANLEGVKASARAYENGATSEQAKEAGTTAAELKENEPATAGGPAPARAYTMDEAKFKYFFGKVTDPKNATRSQQISRVLADNGIVDDAAGRSRLMALIDAAFRAPTLKTEARPYGTGVIKPVQLPTAQLQITFFYENGASAPRVTTIIPREFPKP